MVTPDSCVFCCGGAGFGAVVGAGLDCGGGVP
jgi:hypothetical protein